MGHQDVKMRVIEEAEVKLLFISFENCHLWPLIAKVLEVNMETIDVMWLEGN